LPLSILIGFRFIQPFLGCGIIYGTAKTKNEGAVMRLSYYLTEKNKGYGKSYLYDLVNKLPRKFTTNEFVNHPINRDIKKSSCYSRLQKMKKQRLIFDIGKADDTPQGRIYKTNINYR
jgi:hypothetical protein